MERLYLRLVLGFGLFLNGYAEPSGKLPSFAEPTQDRSVQFFVYLGFPHSVKEEVIHKNEIKAHTVTLPNGANILKGCFSSYDELFYATPLEISEKDRKKIEEILGQCERNSGAENPLAKDIAHQADFKIVWSRDGYGCTLHVYEDLNAIHLFRSDGSGGPLSLRPDLLTRLLALLSQINK